MATNDSSQLCLECGLCCNGVIFANGQLQPGDDTARLKTLGLRLSPVRKFQQFPNLAVASSLWLETGAQRRRYNSRIQSPPKFQQPCAAFDGSRCAVYCDRPKYCREFECLVFKNAQAGRIDARAALRVIRTARRRAEKVKGLLRELGDTSEQTALSVRFRRVKRRVESGVLDDNTADLFGQLSLAVHDLNLLLSEAFYPG